MKWSIKIVFIFVVGSGLIGESDTTETGWKRGSCMQDDIFCAKRLMNENSGFRVLKIPVSYSIKRIIKWLRG